MKTLFLFILFQILVSSCASIINGTTETIHVRSYEPGTRLYLNEREIGSDSAEVIIAKKELKHSVLSAQKVGCRTQQERIRTKFDSISLLGLFIDFGLISILAVDWAYNGAIHHAYKANYVLTPEC